MKLWLANGHPCFINFLLKLTYENRNRHYKYTNLRSQYIFYFMRMKTDSRRRNTPFNSNP